MAPGPFTTPCTGLWPGLRIEIVYNPDVEAAGIYTETRAIVVEPARPDAEDGPLVVLVDGLEQPIEIRRHGFYVVGGQDYAQAWEDAVFGLPDPAYYPYRLYRAPVTLPHTMILGDPPPIKVRIPFRTFERRYREFYDYRGGRAYGYWGWAKAQ